MEELKILLERQFILKDREPELYYRIKDKYKEMKRFIVEKLGYELLIRSDFIKLEKLPGKAEGWMGIDSFEREIEYVFLMLLFIFLEDKNKEDQFLLSHITEFIVANNVGESIEWTSYKNRRSLIKVIKFALDQALIKVTDGEEEGFIKDEDKEVLFESTGLSRYMIRNFNFNIMQIEHHAHLQDNSQAELRRYTVYRRLLLSPVIYNEGSTDEDYVYIKQHRGVIEKDFEEYLGWQLHVHRNGAMVIPSESDRISYSFPKQGAISDIVLHMNALIRSKVEKGEVIIQTNDCMSIKMQTFKMWVEELKTLKYEGWSKEYRESTLEKLYTEVVNFMSKYQMIKREMDEIIVYPLVGKIIGGYPREFGKGETNE